jgi:hypothetical protein
VNFYAISQAGDATPVLELSPALGAGAEEPDAVDFAIASDWTKVTEYVRHRARPALSRSKRT